MDVETLLRNTLAHQAQDAPHAGDDFLTDALAARSARRRKVGAAGIAMTTVVAVVGLAISAPSLTGGGDAAVPATDVAGDSYPMPGQIGPAPAPEQQQAELAAELGITDPPPVPIIGLVTPGQAQRLQDDCMRARGWGDGLEPYSADTMIDVLTGEVSTSSSGGGYTYTPENEAAFDLDSFICMASYPIDPAYVETSTDPYIRSTLVENAGSGLTLPGYDFGPTATHQNTTPAPSPQPTVSWVDNGDFIAVTTWGSSSCPDVPVRWLVTTGTLDIETGPLDPGRDTCSADMSPYTVILEIPIGIDPGQNTLVTLNDEPLALLGLA